MSTEFQEKYGYQWKATLNELDIELAMLRGHRWREEGPYPYYQRAHDLMWPEEDDHRWARLALEHLAVLTVTVLMGPSDTGKTRPAAKWALIEYWIDPENTLVVVSSTEGRGLDLRIWGDIKSLYNRAITRWPRLEGTPVDYKSCITTDVLYSRINRRARDIRRGIVCVPCAKGSDDSGIAKYVGIKQKRLRQVSDECQWMGPSFLDSVPNYLGKDYRACFIGNPLDILDPLGRIAEPVGGWATHPEPTKTTVWDIRLPNSKCINFVGTDSPNFDYPQDRPPRYPYMISWLKINAVAQFWGKNSHHFYSQCMGVMRSGLVGRRVFTPELCRQHRAHDTAVWRGNPLKSIYALDPAYGGEDRCIGGRVEFGEAADGTQIIKVYPPRAFVVIPGKAKKPEDQIAEQLKEELDALGISTHDTFYDPYGKGTLGFSFAKIFKDESPIPVDSGAPATDRPVRYDLMILDKKLGYKRLKKCSEHYSKFSTEAWFSVRYVIECEQMRELPLEVMQDGCLREYGMRTGNKIEIEGKEKTRERMGRSPDLMDWLAVAVEGCRQRGFKIKEEGKILVEGDEGDDVLADLEKQWDRAIESCLLTH